MAENGNHPGVTAKEVRKRVPGSGPILFLAILFVAATFLAWYFSWFGRELSDADISTYLADVNKPRHVQHALLQIQQRIERGDPSAKNWYPQLITLSRNPETEYRLTVAWLMGFDNRSQEFHTALQQLLKDSEPIVRRNAALALIRFDDRSGHDELLAVLMPQVVYAPAAGVVVSSLHAESTIARRTLLARIQQLDHTVVEVRSPLPGRIHEIMKPNGSQVLQGDGMLNLNADEESVWEALRGLALIGTYRDVETIDGYLEFSKPSARIRDQATATKAAIMKKPVHDPF